MKEPRLGVFEHVNALYSVLYTLFTSTGQAGSRLRQGEVSGHSEFLASYILPFRLLWEFLSDGCVCLW